MVDISHFPNRVSRRLVWRSFRSSRFILIVLARKPSKMASRFERLTFTPPTLPVVFDFLR